MIQLALLALARELLTAPVSRVRSRDQNMVSVKKNTTTKEENLAPSTQKDRASMQWEDVQTKIAAHLFCVTVTSATAAPADDAAPQFFVPLSCRKLWVQEYLLVLSE